MRTATPFNEEGVRGFLHRPAGQVAGGLVLAHGAGGNCEAPLLIAAADAFCAAGFAVLRIDLPFRQRRPKGPPSRHAAAEDRAGLRNAAAAMRKLVPDPVMLGGHSYGGRQATMLAAEEPEVANALLLLSYPLHPPDKPAQLRTAHFPNLRVPAVFVHGTSDPFASNAEMEAAVALIPAPTSLVSIAGAGHDLKRGSLGFSWKAVVNALIAASRHP